MSSYLLHPAFQNGLHNVGAVFDGGTLVCNCASRPVKVKVSADIAHNHACGCTKCWKPEGASFSIVAVAPSDKVTVVENADKLTVVDPSAVILRHACQECGVHMHGPVEKDHPFKGLSFIHPERFETDGWPAPGFAAFVSSAIEGGVDPADMESIRAEFKKMGLEPYDCLNPALMDYMATWAAKKSGVIGV